MTFEVAIQVLIGVLGLVSAAIPFLGARAQHRAQQSDLDSIVAVLNAIPEDSSVRKRVEEHAESLVALLVERSFYQRRPAGIALGLIFIAAAVGAGIAVINAGGAWMWALIPIVFVIILGAFGATLDATKRKRDVGGKVVE